MKKDRIKTAPKTVEKVLRLKSATQKKQIAFPVFFVVAIIAVLILKIYKTMYAGIIYDEAMTCLHFADDIRHALHPAAIPNKNVPLTNNHALNSIFIYYAQKFFNSYEFYIRIPSLTAGIIFTLALAYIIYKTIHSCILRLTTFILISLSPFVFDYSFLARGYAFGLAALFTQIALLLWWLDHKKSFRSWPKPALIISALNFLAFGATLSSLFFLAAFNLTFVLLFSSKIFYDSPKKLRTIIITGLTIFLVSFTAVFLLYHNSYADIANDPVVKESNKNWGGWSSFAQLLHDLFLIRVFRSSDAAGIIIPVALAALAVGAMAFYIYKLRDALKQRTGWKYIKQDDRVFLVSIITGLYVIFLFLYGVILRRSLGFDRNIIFIIPMVLIGISIILDRFAQALKKKILTRLVIAAAAIVMLATIMHNPVSPYFVFDSASISGPLVRKLHTIDPFRTWNIEFSRQTRLFPMAFLYYQQFDYKFRVLGVMKRPEVLVCRLSEKPIDKFCLDSDHFARANCAVVLNESFPFDRVVLTIKLKKN
ncbi:MAG: hypothetical protein AMJ79_05730 [Phycisphaerae bacterium SM23_30]|nr:MAG: hypothetical protein AMJ79_05730 [Phycisphaerae bacterium SM23_30]